MHADVVVVGGGYAGAVATKRMLLKNPKLKVTVVNPRAEFVERIRLHQLAAGNHSATMPLTEALHAKSRLVLGAVTSIDAQRQAVHLAAGESISYDHLVYAVGSVSRLDHIDGAREHAFAVAEYESALALRQQLQTTPAGAPVVVVGGGLTGVETAAELAELRPELSVTLVSNGRIADGLSDKARGKILRVLASRSVEVIEGSRVTRIDDSKVEMDDGRVLATECAVVAMASAVPALALESGLPTDEDGRLRVDGTLSCPSSPNIVGAGDAVSIDDMPLRMSCQAAVPLGAHAADTVLRRIAGKRPKAVNPKFVDQAISLGRRAGVVQFTDFKDNPGSIVVGGRTGALIKEQICAAALNWAVNPRRPVTYTWS